MWTVIILAVVACAAWFAFCSYSLNKYYKNRYEDQVEDHVDRIVRNFYALHEEHKTR